MIASIVIVSWNTRDLLARCLSSIEGDGGGRSLPDREVFVVDNSSADGSARLVRERFPWVRLLENHDNVGFARASNQAIRRGTGRYVILLNPDCDAGPGALPALVRFMEQHADAAVAGPRLLSPDGSLQPSCFPFPTLLRELCRLFHLRALWPPAGYRMERWSTDAPRAVDVVQGACLIIRRSVLDAIGLLDEDYFVYSEEVDLCHRVHAHGGGIYWVPAVSVVHAGGASTRQAQAAMFLRLYQSKVLFFRKRHGPQAARAYKLLVALASLARLGLVPATLLERAPARGRHLDRAADYGRLLRLLPSL